MDDIYKKIEEYNSNKKENIDCIWWYDCRMLSNKKFNPIITELFIRGRKLNICLVFITQSYFPVPRNIIQNSTHHLVIKIPHRRELQQITFNHSSDIDFQDYMNLYKKVNCKTIFVFGYWHYSCIS